MSDCGRYVQAADDAADAQWFQVGDVPALAFDHKKVLSDCFAFASKMSAARDTSIVDILTDASQKLADK